ncbi:MAG: hypothetical protein ACOYLB_05535 [Phototrophicaceae bacterium]
MSNKTPFRYTHEHNAAHKFVYIQLYGFITAKDQMEMREAIYRIYAHIPKPIRLVLDYNQSDTNINELISTLTDLPKTYQGLRQHRVSEILIINGKSSWGRMSANLAIHPRYGGIVMRVYTSYESMLEYVSRYPL